MLISYKRGQGSIVLRVKILNSSVSTGAGLTGLTFSSSGLIISTIADNEASPVAYTQAGSTIETITTLGTYAAPTATKCRFKEVDNTNHKGVYEIQIADARFAVSSAKSLIVSISGVTNLAETDVCIPLRDMDPYDSVRAGLGALPNAAANANGGLPILSTAGTTLAYTVSTLTTYTGNTPQTGDAFARIGAAGAGLTALGDARIANLDAAVSTRLAGASYTAPDNASITAIGVLSTAIKAKTDQLTFTVSLHVDATATATINPADIRSAIGMASADLDTQLDTILAATGGAGGGSVTWPITIDDGTNPIDGAAVWITTDLAGANIIAGTLFTNALGIATFLLDPGPYFAWAQHARYNGTNPTAIVVA